MTTTPEQLQAWREEFEKNENPYHTDRLPNEMYTLNGVQNRWQGYLRRCQETEARLLDDRRTAEAINNLTSIAKEFHTHGSLRIRLSGIVVALVQGLHRDKQETEQAIKDVRKKALAEAIAICKTSGWNTAGDLMAKKIKELLK